MSAYLICGSVRANGPGDWPQFREPGAPASPSAHAEGLYVRTQTKLYRIAGKNRK